MPQVTEMAYLRSIYLEAEYGIGAPVLPLGCIVISRDTFKMYALDFGSVLNHCGITSHGSHIAVVKMVMAHRDDISRLFYLPIM